MEVHFLVNGTEHVHCYPSNYGWHYEKDKFLLHVVRAFDPEIDDEPDYEMENDGDEVMSVATYQSHFIIYVKSDAITEDVEET